MILNFQLASAVAYLINWILYRYENAVLININRFNYHDFEACTEFEIMTVKNLVSTCIQTCSVLLIPSSIFTGN